MRASEFRSLWMALQAEEPIRYHRLVVKQVEMKDHGNTSLSDTEKTITITIRAQDPPTAQKDSLVHEWGHAREFDEWKTHGAKWGQYQAAAYRARLKWEEG